MTYELDETLITAEELRQKVIEIGKEIRKDFHGEQFIMIIVLKGGFIFAADLIRELEGGDITVDFVTISTYGKETDSTGEVRMLNDISTNITGKNVLLVDDIIDSGLTLSYLKKHLQLQKPKSLKICAMLDKQARRKFDVEIDYRGFNIPDKFVVGYGTDYAEMYRNLPYVATVKKV